MATNKEKQNLRFKNTSQRLHNKVRYDGFSKDEVTIIIFGQMLHVKITIVLFGIE
jgi:hypothetical protein